MAAWFHLYADGRSGDCFRIADLSGTGLRNDLRIDVYQHSGTLRLLRTDAVALICFHFGAFAGALNWMDLATSARRFNWSRV
jgi:hypothetical protein